MARPRKSRSDTIEKAAARAAQPSDQFSAQPSDQPSDRYLNRELTWLEFNRRVLHEAADSRTPLLERVNFLSIFNSNLDEFFMKRVGLLKRQVEANIVSRRPDGLSPQRQLSASRQKVLDMIAWQADIFRQHIVPALAQSGIRILQYRELSPVQRRFADNYFRRQVFAVLTPLAVDPGHPFPFLSNLSTSLGVTLRHPDRDGRLFARVKVPEVLPQMIRIEPPDSGATHQFVSLMDLIRHNLDELFPGMVVLNVLPFRITRNAEVEHDMEDSQDLLDVVEQELRQRRFERVVRLEHSAGPDPWMLEFLLQELALAAEDVYEMPALLDYTTLKAIASLPVAPLRYEPWTPLVPTALAQEDVDIFSVIRNGDVLVHHPYESFPASVERFVTAAATDPNVLAIKITLYRTSDDSPFIHTLIRAAEAGKQVVALVELKARFDEERNIFLAQALEKVGVHVVYGIMGLKTHTKATLVVRQEPDGLRCYAHIGTGNYHEQTAKLYTDVGLFTCRSDITEELVDLFHYLTGRSLKREYRRLLVAPLNMIGRFLAMIQQEIANKAAGRPARIIAKMNSLEEQTICNALYRASQAGVQVDLIVRGFCCLRPGVAGLSENIRVRSIIGRFLEHSRVYYFASGGENPLDGEFFIGSADWMYRNLLSRVEVVTPVQEHRARMRLWEMLELMLADQRQSWEMQSDGSYVQHTPPPDSTAPEAMGVHKAMMQITRNLAAQGIAK